MAYPLAAFVTGWLAQRGLDRRVGTSILAMAAGLGVVFAGGVLWLAKYPARAGRWRWGLYPFLFVDAVKIVASATVLPAAWRVLDSDAAR